MRGLGNIAKRAVFIATAVLSATALAQNDPRVPVTFNQFLPAEVNNVGAVSQSKEGTPEFKSQVTYLFTISNGTTNDLARSFFKASVENATSTAQTAPSIAAAIAVNGTCDTVLADSLSVNCKLGSNGTLAPGSSGSAKVYLVVNVPYDGQELAVRWQGGGYEGNGIGNGCCQPGGTYLTKMSERTIDASFTTTLQSFLDKDGGKYFTGDKHLSKPGDEGTTYVSVPKVADAYNAETIDKYLVFLSETFVNPSKFATAGTLEARCAASRRFDRCFRTSLSILEDQVIVPPDLTDQDGSKLYLADRLLDVIVRIDSSFIKNSTKIGDVIIKYEGRTDPVYACEYRLVTVGLVTTTYLNGGPNNSKLPCYTERFQYSPSTPGYTQVLNKDFEWRLKNFKNGFLEFE